MSLEPKEIPLWSEGAPGTEGLKNEESLMNQRVRNVHQPALIPHLPPQELSTGAGILVCPGGAYRHLTIWKEGHQIANWLNTLGLAAFVLKYRLDRTKALQDAKRAMRYIRAFRKPYGLDPQKIGAMGFSAGAHLIFNLMLNSDDGDPDASDSTERRSCRPDFLAPIYVSLKGLDVETDLQEKAPPVFLAGASNDKTTPPEQAIRVYQTVAQTGAPVELHLYEQGGHGFGLGKTKGPIANWTIQCENWFRLHGLLGLK